MNIEIAGVNFTINCKDSIAIGELPAVYQPFLRKTNSVDGFMNIDISLELNNVPATNNMKKIFDTDQSWSMFFHDDEYFLSLNTSEHEKKAVWIAKFNLNFKEVIIYCTEKLVNKSNGKTTVPNPFCYPFNQILLMYSLAQRNGALIHAAGLELNNRGYIFPGKSGAGKSTLSRQFSGRNDLEIISDDRIVVRKINDTFKAFGTPWPGDAGIALNKSVSLSGIFFISKASYNRIEEIKPLKALEKLLPVVSIPWYDKEVMIKILDFCDDLISYVPAYELYFKPDNEVVNVFEEFVSKE